MNIVSFIVARCLRTIALIAIVAFCYLTLFGLLPRLSDLTLLRSLAQSKRGDVNGAIERLQVAIATKPTARRLLSLGALLGSQERLEEALDCMRRADAMDPSRGIYLANQAMLMGGAGRKEISVTMMASACEREPTNIGFTCLYCLYLADVNRIDEAHEQLRRAEELESCQADQVDASYVGRRDGLLKQCRERLPSTSPRAFPVDIDVHQ